MSEIIVYLDEYKYDGDGKYDIMYLDFRTSSDFVRYLNEVGVKERTHGSYLEIKGYRSPRRLMQGCYYALNVDMLKKLTPVVHPESLLLSQTYDFSNYEDQNDENYRLLQSHEPLQAAELKVSYHNRIDNIDELKYKYEVSSFRVNDVSQANWNELLDNDDVKVVYDVGAPVNASEAEVRRYIDLYFPHYSDTNPCLVLSHWDKDHYHCLIGMSDKEISCFSMFICVDKIPTTTASNLFKRIEGILGKKRIFCIAPPAKKRGRSSSVMTEKYSNDALAIYVGSNSRNINYSGIILYAQGLNGNVVLPGDSQPTQANHVLVRQMAKVGNTPYNHYLVVPHHGGEFKVRSHKIYHITGNLTPISSIISVDADNNSYGHPKTEMINWLKSVARWKVERTDQAGTLKYNL